MRVCHSVATWPIRARSSSDSSSAVSSRSRCTSREEISRCTSSVLLRCTSVGWAVSTGITQASLSRRRIRALFTPCALSDSMAWRRLPRSGPAPARARSRWRRFWSRSSAMLDRCRK
ncbi:Uncharacterised protein [Bordetella pertussis]|nr:Uncharacterised protein [Bordetella pertussis]CFW09170.1 Uncharacterised protein [Bordetella pertussis]